MAKRKRSYVQRSSEEKIASSDAGEIVLAPLISSDEPPTKQVKWTNRQRVLVFSSRGITARARHLLKNLRRLMPHSKSESKMNKKEQFFVINEICEMKNCNKCIFFEARKKDLYMWMSNIPNGPCARFLVENVHTMLELKLTGNCLKGSRPLLSFDETFDTKPHWRVLKELFVQIFSTPNHHPKSQPFIDHVFTFTILDNRIWFRNYQIIEEDASLVEIGPRFVLNLIKIFDGSFAGTLLYINPHYSSPNVHRRLLRKLSSEKYMSKVKTKLSQKSSRPTTSYKVDPTDDIFEKLE